MSEENTNVDKIKDILANMDEDFLDPSLIVDNKSYFQFDNKSYMVIMPSPKDLSNAEVVRNQTYGRLLNTEGYHLLDNLKKLLKDKQGVDVDDLYKEKEEVIKRLQYKYLDLAGLGESKSLDRIDELKKEIHGIKLKLRDLTLKIENLIFPSIEKQMEARYIEFLTYSCTKVLVEPTEEKYENVWKSIEEFESDRTNLPLKALDKMTQLLLNSREIL